MKKIVIRTADVEAEAELNDSLTAEAVWQALPIEATVNTWGEEIYFKIPVECELEADARELVEKGDLGYWPTGQAFCIFFGSTPISSPGEIRPASPVNVIGRVLDDPEKFLNVATGSAIRVERGNS
ncbi:MAG: hypothetical protein JRJ12_05065 [Deltaproteobacteria bacterium]|nr:hypothetical protein [Deltaproteobacteria bacterium]MBW2069963.1 hypothetical protein [Deltaproteobacteria bacterium]